MRGILVALRGHGFIFLDGTMDAKEERLTLAHELAHFLFHYQTPRAHALAVLGENIRPVLNGERAATPSEQLSSALREVPLGMFRHILDREEGGLPDANTLKIELEADLIAYELLAPSDDVAQRTAPGTPCREALEEIYGLPAGAAMAWGIWIDARRRSDDPLIARLAGCAKKNQ